MNYEEMLKDIEESSCIRCKKEEIMRKVASIMTAGGMSFGVRLSYRSAQGGTKYMDNLICIPNDTSLRTLSAFGKKLEEELQEQFGTYDPTVCWQLLDNELTMQILMREKECYNLFGKVDFSSVVLDENAKEYLLRFYSSLPEETFRYSEERLSALSIIEKSVADFVLKEKGCQFLLEKKICLC